MELKLDIVNDPNGNPLSIYRTIMELKLVFLDIGVRVLCGIYRTIMELKQLKHGLASDRSGGIYRTIMELKPEKYKRDVQPDHVFIEPSWN